MLDGFKLPKNARLQLLTDFELYPRSIVESQDTTFFMVRQPALKGESPAKWLAVVGDTTGFDGMSYGDVLLCPLSPGNAVALRERLPWLRPRPLGLATSAGCGDRLGLATPGHIRALRQVLGPAPSRAGIAPILAQQSMRENARTGRTPQQVMDDALWGVLQEGWREPWGADADHLKTTADVDLCVAAGYTFYTVDPGDHVDNSAHSASLDELQNKYVALPWADLEDSPDAQRSRYLGREFAVEAFTLAFDETSLLRAACKYGRAVLHAVRMYRHLALHSLGLTAIAPGKSGRMHPGGPQGPEPGFELEVSVDETATPTSPLEHLFVAAELRRLGVQWVSLAPRYLGRFEKGVDYIGDLAGFEADLACHAAIARSFGPYKLSLHSGSDKFSIYPIMARHAAGLVHLKTAGTSYLEALRAIAAVEPSLFRDILAFAHTRYDEDKATYHVSADPGRVPAPGDLADAALPSVLDQFDGRQMLHVTFGSVLDRFGSQLKAVLAAHEERHYATLEAHFVRHLSPFASRGV